jgi:hypothetical protein
LCPRRRNSWCAGGVATASQLRAGTRRTINGHGFSVQTAVTVSVDELARGGQFPNRRISVTTAEELRALGLNALTRGAGAYHGTVMVPDPPRPEIFEAISRCFTTRPNPFIAS